jgi:hypothetical protein
MTQEKILFTRNLKLATALATCGVPFRKNEPFVVMEDADNGNQRSVTFFFSDTEDGIGGRIMDTWEKGWQAITNPEDPIAYIRATLENRERILDAMNNATPLVKKSFGKATLLISKNATPELKKKLSRYL